MDELDKKIADVLDNAKEIDYQGDVEWATSIADIKKAFAKAGYIKLPNAQNITITTSDNPNDKLMTREQWEAERE